MSINHFEQVVIFAKGRASLIIDNSTLRSLMFRSRIILFKILQANTNVMYDTMLTKLYIFCLTNGRGNAIQLAT